jgi:hypothetical protein
MKQGWIAMPLAAALMFAAPAIGIGQAHAAASKAAGPTTSTAKTASTRQFTGWVTALDKNSITVEKRGKAPRTMTFARHAQMSTTGDLEKDAHVTVYYRDEDGRAVARKVVVKPAVTAAGNGR